MTTAAAPAATSAARAAAAGETFSPETRLTMAPLSYEEPDELARERPDEPVLPDDLLREPLAVLLPLLFEERDPLAVLLPLPERAFDELDFDAPDFDEREREEP